MNSIITLTTDFGSESPYVAAIKGVILGINPSACIVDLTHGIGPQDLSHTAFFLATTIPYFPKGVVHLIVVDPGVGTDRPLLYVNLDGHRMLVPDNGCWTELARKMGTAPLVIRLAESRYWREAISSTFHGRDILAPVAGHLSLGVDASQLGPATDQWCDLKLPEPQRGMEGLTGEVLFVDHFGNLITNIPGTSLAQLQGKPVVRVAGHEISREVRHYAEAERGSPVWLTSSFGLLEIAEREGNASKRLNAGVGARVEVQQTAASSTQTGGPLLISLPEPIETPVLGLDVAPPVEPQPFPGPPADSVSAAGENREFISSEFPHVSRPGLVQRGMRESIFIVAVVIPLISYSILATIAVAILYLRPQSHPLEYLPDLEGDFKGSKRDKQTSIIYERPQPDAELPDKLRVALGHTIALGALEVTPLNVDLRRLKIRQPGVSSETTMQDSLVLHLRFKNTSDDLTFSPTDPFFDRRWKDMSYGSKPYTFLQIGERRLYGGALAWNRGEPSENREKIDGQDYRLLHPGEESTTIVCSDPTDSVAELLQNYHGPLQWRIQVRRGLAQVGDRQIPATAVIGVSFTDEDIRKQ
jgi:S-adenosylmethionine hydrolase